MIRPKPKTIAYRRAKAQEMRNDLLHYRQSLDSRRARILTLASIAAKLANLINLETDGKAGPQVQAIWQAYLSLKQLDKS